ncbi:Xaa-Pro peptidase family protein [Candidatus Gracilibacteria bacterium]|nr:Xaa-Pro peptidase family protein [Candidatus Gracilibacteria bacterium]
MTPNISKLENLNLSGNYLISKSSDIKYLLGLQESNRIEILIKNKVFSILANALILEEISKKFDRYDIVDVEDKDRIKALFSKIKLLKVDSTQTTLSRIERIEKLGVKKIKGIESVVSNLRKVKTSEEIELIRKSQEINLKAFEVVLDKIRLGMTEFEIAKLIKIAHLKLGATGESFEPIVAFSDGGSCPHHTNSNERKLVKGDQILFDFGCIYNGYCSDMTRVVFTTKPNPEQKQFYDLLKYTNEECMKFGKIGMEYKKLHQKANQILGENSKFFTHNLGHGIGIDIHETPLGMRDLSTKIEENDVFTIEPGLYFPEKFGFRYENIIVVKNGKLVNILGEIEDKDYALGL